MKLTACDMFWVGLAVNWVALTLWLSLLLPLLIVLIQYGQICVDFYGVCGIKNILSGVYSSDIIISSHQVDC